MGGSTNVQAPQISPQEKDLMTQQTNLLKQQQMLIQQSAHAQNLLAPFLYKSLGLTPTLDQAGNLTGFTQDPRQAALQSEQLDITKALFDRQKLALAGKLPVDPGLLNQLKETEAQLHQRLQTNLGPGWQTSSSGIQALNQWDLYKNNILEGARRGDLTMAEQLGLGMQGGWQQGSQFLTQGASSVAAGPANYGQLFAQAAQGYNAPLQIFENTRQMQTNAAIANAQSNAAASAGLGTGIGSLVGMLGSAAILASSKEFKEELGEGTPVLLRLADLPIKRWKYKEEMGMGEEPHIGPYAEDFRDRFGVGDGKTIHLLDYLGVQLAATQEIAKEINELKSSAFLSRAA